MGIDLMVVDDDDIDAEVVTRVARRSGAVRSLVRAKDGEEALELLQSSTDRPQVVLLDINMPRMNGHEFLTELRAHNDNSLRRTVVFVLSTSEDERDLHQAYDRHAAGYIPKSTFHSDRAQIERLLTSYDATVRLP